MRELVYYVAVSIDGFIAEPDGAFDAFPVTGDHLEALTGEFGDAVPAHAFEALGMEPPRTRFDTVIQGRASYQIALDAGIERPYAHLREFVATRSDAVPPDGVTYTADPLGTVRELKQEDGLDVYLCGGGRLAGSLLPEATETGCVLILPTDVVAAKEFKANAEHRTVEIGHVHADEMILDVGPKSIAEFANRLKVTKTVVWNGPFGAFETLPFDKATVAAAKAVAAETKAGNLISVAGGGDTVAALNHAGVSADFTYISTAGGAFLEWLEGKTLPGVEALAHSKG